MKTESPDRHPGRNRDGTRSDTKLWHPSPPIWRTACHPRRVIIQQCDTRLPDTKDDGPPTISRNIKAHKPDNSPPCPNKIRKKSPIAPSPSKYHILVCLTWKGEEWGVSDRGIAQWGMGCHPEVHGPGHSTPNKYNLILMHVKHST